MRKIIQIAFEYYSDDLHYKYAFCNDGTVWFWDTVESKWVLDHTYENIPQD